MKCAAHIASSTARREAELDRDGENLIVRIDRRNAGGAGFADPGAAKFLRDRAGAVADDGSVGDDAPRLLQELEMLSGRACGVGVEIAAQFRHRDRRSACADRRFKPQRTGERAGNQDSSEYALEAELPVTERDDEERSNEEHRAARRDESDIGEEKRREHDERSGDPPLARAPEVAGRAEKREGADKKNAALEM